MKLLLASALLLGALTQGMQLDRYIRDVQRDLDDANAQGQLFAVLVAGSNGYYNYRHQADICHAYQIMSSHGIPDENIIVLMYDDIANNEQNPTKGIVINHLNGSDVYHDVPKDYTGDDVTPENFLKIIQGEDMTGIGSGKTLKSGPNDHVFINFADHGGPGIIAFPTELLQADDLNNALKNAHQKNIYNKLVFYLEACESGSMFNTLLPSDINIYATTASDPDHSSYACYYDSYRETYLGDVYSVNWMEDTDAENIETETLNQQFKIVKNETTTSSVQEYGDLSIGSMVVGEFQGRTDTTEKTERVSTAADDAVIAPEVREAVLIQVMDDETKPEERRQAAKEELIQLVETKNLMRLTMNRIVESSVSSEHVAHVLTHTPREITQHACYYPLVQRFHTECYNLGQEEYGLRLIKAFANMCEMGYNANNEVHQVISYVCASK